MIFWELLFLLVGIGIIGIGVYVKVQNYRLTHLGRLVNAVVVRSVQSYMKVLGWELPCYENTLQISTAQGTVTKAIKEETLRETSSYIRGYYIERSGKFMKEEDVNKNKGSGPLILIGFGVVWCAIILLAMWMESSELGAAVGGRIFGYGIAVAFIAVGAWVGICVPGKRKKELSDTHSVEGRLVDFRAEEDEDGMVSYFPIYEYHQYGEPRILHGSIGGSAKKYRQVGREVQIVINDATGEIYCAEDSKSSGRFGLLFLAVGLGLFAILLYSDVKQYQETLNAEEDRYQDVISEIPEDVKYVEYYYSPLTEEAGNYAYRIVVYGDGAGEVILFPIQVMADRTFQQCFSFSVSDRQRTVLNEDVAQYDFSELYGEENTGGAFSEYIYYYNGEERKGSGGYESQAESFTAVREHICNAVPDSVWDAMEEEMRQYFQ